MLTYYKLDLSSRKCIKSSALVDHKYRFLLLILIKQLNGITYREQKDALNC